MVVKLSLKDYLFNWYYILKGELVELFYNLYERMKRK